MTNPYESPSQSPHETNASPVWYVWFYKAYWPAWWGGLALIACSQLDIPKPMLGWIGFGLAATAAIGSYLLPSLAGIKPDDYVVLDSHQFHTRGEAYRNIMARFQNGATLMHDGVAFGIYPNHEIACGVIVYSTEVNEEIAAELAGHAKAVFDKLSSESQEFKSVAGGRTFRISIMTYVEHTPHVFCRFTDGKLEWLG